MVYIGKGPCNHATQTNLGAVSVKLLVTRFAPACAEGVRRLLNLKNIKQVVGCRLNSAVIMLIDSNT